MKEAKKVERILNAWLEYISLEDYSKAGLEIEKNPLKLNGVALTDNRVLIEQATFLELQHKESKKLQSSQEAIWALSFPQIRTLENNEKNYLRPLFSLDITSILKGIYQSEGWNINELNLTEAGANLAKFLNLDDEEREQLNTQNGLRNLLVSTFSLDLETTYEDWMKLFHIYRLYNIEEIKLQPYLFKFTGSGFSYNLKQDLKDIKKEIILDSKKWSKGHPAYEYLFGEPQPPKDEVTYLGVFPTYPPTNSQLLALKHAQTEPLTAVQGPPGSGKTTLILHLIAQQVVKRALKLIEAGENYNNLTVISSTNNKAVENVIEKLDEWLNDDPLEHDFLYLKGGNKETIRNFASEQLKKAIYYLQTNYFDESRYDYLKQKIQQIKYDFEVEENNYLEKRKQRYSDEEQLPQLQDKIQTLEQDLEEIVEARTNFEGRVVDLAKYEQLPIKDYKHLKVIFDTAEMQLPTGRIYWWKKILLWLTGRTERQILRKTAKDCQSAILNTLSTIFPVEVPRTRSELVQEAQLVRERLDKGEELKRVQARLQENSEDIEITETEKNQASEELSILENRLTNPLEDFYSTFQEKFHEQHQELFKLSREFLTQQALQTKDEIKKTLELYSYFLSESGRPKYKYKSKMEENLDEHLENLSLIFPVITSTLLSIRNMLPSVSECVDRIIVDEAGMIPLHQTFPLLVRSRQAIIVGDPLQIEPIITLSDERSKNYRQTAFLDKGLTEVDYHRYSPEEEYSATTYHRAAEASGEENNKGQGICLKEHYRCQPNIIEYCNYIARYGLEVKTELVDSLLESNLIAYHVEGNIQNNVNQEEITAVGEIIEHLLKQGYLLEDMGVISPFRAQANILKEAILKKFPKFNKESVGTIHKFQGSEKRVIILSTKVCQPSDNVNWINKRPNMLNVAVSRAKEVFILVGNLYRLEKGRFTHKLVEHIRDKGIILEYKTEAEIPQPEPGTTVVYDCDHLRVFRETLQLAQEELIIVTPWIRGYESKQFVNDIVPVLNRGVKVLVVYGNQDLKNGENDNNDAHIENELRIKFSQFNSRLIRLGQDLYIESEGTNQRILVCDTKFAIVGSWNWLSHPYRKQCSKSLTNPKAQIRRETSIQISEPSFIENVKAKIYQSNQLDKEQ